MVKLNGQYYSETEQRILDVASQQFIKNGMDGTSIQQIADAARINKSLVHYYFRSKEKLFSQVFIRAFTTFLSVIEEILALEVSFLTKIDKIVDNYIDLLSQNRFLPLFILHEINRDPDRLYNLMKDARINPELIIKDIQQAVGKGEIRPVDPRHLMINILSMCIFPFVARPLLLRLLFTGNENSYDQFLSGRKKEIIQFIQNSIRVER
jgi:AcrR family transcriptional regulator